MDTPIKYNSNVIYYYWIYSNKIPGYMSYGIIKEKKNFESIFLGMVTWFLTLIIFGIINLTLVGLLLTNLDFDNIVNLSICMLFFFLPTVIVPPFIISQYPKLLLFRKLIDFFSR